MRNAIFICGTNTGDGKTVFTGLLTSFARQRGLDAVAIKPFCSGDIADVEFLQKCQDFRLKKEEINPWFFEKPLSPYAAIYKVKSKNHFEKSLTIDCVRQHIEHLCKKHDLVFIEGIGGVMVPIDKNFFYIDLVRACNGNAILVAKNQLGVLNHVFLNIEIFRKNEIFCPAVALVEQENPDLSAKSNIEIISEISRQIATFEIPFLRGDKMLKSQENKIQKKLKKILARILELYKF